ncbi:unnamed protein product [Spirodela intermedia]|uniref:Uncharacterized protein n=1 Tax=Spirodela intermedia TaxID=51605 RepID=A0ABN7E8H5_SPIIN|nr:unnamed protein product [Spirodela intermedia]
MVIPVRDDIWAKCRIHDVLHDFTITKAKEGEKAWCWDSESTPRLRTLLTFGATRKFGKNRTCPFLHLKLLRVVDLEWASIDELPKQVGDLIHLRYLGLKDTKITSLPPYARSSFHTKWSRRCWWQA